MTASCSRMIQPAKGGNEDLPGLKGDGHRLNLPTSRDNRQLSTGGEPG